MHAADAARTRFIPVVALVVHLLTIGDQADQLLIDHPMRHEGPLANAPIAVLINAARPRPALTRATLFNVSPEVDLMRRHYAATVAFNAGWAVTANVSLKVCIALPAASFMTGSCISAG